MERRERVDRGIGEGLPRCRCRRPPRSCSPLAPHFLLALVSTFQFLWEWKLRQGAEEGGEDEQEDARSPSDIHADGL